MVLEVKTSTSKTFDEPQKSPFKAKILDVYWNKSYIDDYNFI